MADEPKRLKWQKSYTIYCLGATLIWSLGFALRYQSALHSSTTPVATKLGNSFQQTVPGIILSFLFACAAAYFFYRHKTHGPTIDTKAKVVAFAMGSYVLGILSFLFGLSLNTYIYGKTYFDLTGNVLQLSSLPLITGYYLLWNGFQPPILMVVTFMGAALLKGRAVPPTLSVNSATDDQKQPMEPSQYLRRLNYYRIYIIVVALGWSWAGIWLYNLSFHDSPGSLVAGESYCGGIFAFVFASMAGFLFYRLPESKNRKNESARITKYALLYYVFGVSAFIGGTLVFDIITKSLNFFDSNIYSIADGMFPSDRFFFTLILVMYFALIGIPIAWVTVAIASALKPPQQDISKPDPPTDDEMLAELEREHGGESAEKAESEEEIRRRI